MRERLRSALLTITVSAGTLMPVTANGEDFGVLLGFASQDYPEQYETVYAAKVDGRMPTFWTAPDLVVPHAGELWRATIVRRTAGRPGQIVEDSFWLGRIGASPVLEPIEWGGCTEESAGSSSAGVDILFLSPSYVGLRLSAFGDCGAYPGGGSRLETRAFPDSPPLDMREVFGPAVRSTAANGAAAVYQFPGIGEECHELTDPDDWTLARHRGILDVDNQTMDLPDLPAEELARMVEESRLARGSWHILTQLTPTMGICGSGSFEFGVDVPIPPQLTANVPLPLPFTTLLERFPSTRDATAATCTSAAVLIGNDIKIVNITPSGEIETVLAQFACSETKCTRLVMAEWFCAERLSRWHAPLTQQMR